MTGGTGFIGGHVARQLRERGDDVTALVRDPAKATALKELGCRVVAGDLSDVAAIEAGLEGADAAIHGAAVYEVGIPKSEHPRMREANVVGTENVLGACLARRDAEGRLRLDDRRLRQHPRRGRRRDLRAPRRQLHVLLRTDEVRGPPGRQAPDRGRAAVRDRPARRRVRARRPLGDRQADERLPRRPDADDRLRRPRDEHGPRRRRRRRRSARARQGRARRVLQPRR